MHENNKHEPSNFNWCLIIALIISLYFPSSLGGVINPYLTVLSYCLAIFIILFGALLFKVTLSKKLLSFSFLLLLTLSAMSVFSPFGHLTLGALVPYIALCLICSINIRDLYFTKNQIRVVLLLILSLLIFALCISFESKAVIEFQRTFYQQLYPELFDFMVTWANKPVIVFATHSVAGFAFFIIAFVCLVFSRLVCTFSAKCILRFFSVAFSILLLLLLSNTGFFLFFIMVLAYFYYIFRAVNVVIVMLFLLVLFYFIFINLNTVVWFVEDVSKLFFNVVLREDNGLLSRFSLGGRLAGSYAYVFDSPILGVGFTSGGDLAFGDNILSEYVLRGGFFGYFLVLVIVVGYLYSNIKSFASFILVLGFVFVSDLGYPLFVASRFVFIFPVLIVLVNMYFEMNLSKIDKQQKITADLKRAEQ
ncbi:hypothetical protein [Rheinheimera sp. MMS21-TC3]|uniref:hypothetical protein n=1 Tax=Rheinheimera sp. MMS21-TC3 TaxID=3072790 RepID=UPI0028C42BFA|nr:hypothetical protein [Rheinheimera sp. MMS21-TC3]WNO61676.1 hypothetical protein RDV63_12170 [Rheinheimera sp. MMS21-TC3]